MSRSCAATSSLACEVGRPARVVHLRVPHPHVRDRRAVHGHGAQPERAEVAREHAHEQVGEHGEVRPGQEDLVDLGVGHPPPALVHRGGVGQRLLDGTLRVEGSVPRQHHRTVGDDGVLPLLPGELRVDPRGVEVLRVVLEQQLPVEGALGGLALGELEFVRGVRVDGGREGTEVEHRRLGDRADEHEPRPLGDAHLEQAEVLGVEGRRALHPVAGRQRAVEPVAPRVVGAAQHAAGPAPVGHGGTPVPARVEEGLELALGRAGDDHGHVAGVRRHPAAVGHVVDHAHAGPAGAEHRAELLPVVVGVAVPPRVEGGGPGQRVDLGGAVERGRRRGMAGRIAGHCHRAPDYPFLTGQSGSTIDSAWPA